jgi:hypothetical protein
MNSSVKLNATRKGQLTLANTSIWESQKNQTQMLHKSRKTEEDYFEARYCLLQ